ncbi:hypothetical protein DFJ74DRAFT_704987 [Hyaloraphidium curvatum]|nr:hypothetical protein DFJ74DRAFT_704987 [Hyaloraphidium curvatum]
MATLEPPPLSDGSPGGGIGSPPPARETDRWLAALGALWTALWDLARLSGLPTEAAVAFAADPRRLLDADAAGGLPEKMAAWAGSAPAEAAANPAGTDPRLARWPHGYALVARGAGKADDAPAHLAGHPSRSEFRSPDEFWPHLVWLFGGARGACACRPCRRRPIRPLDAARAALGPEADLRSRTLPRPERGRAPDFRPGDLVWLHLEQTGAGGVRLASDAVLGSVRGLAHLPRGITRAPFVVAARSPDPDGDGYLYSLAGADGGPVGAVAGVPEHRVLPFLHYPPPSPAQADPGVAARLARREYFSFVPSDPGSPSPASPDGLVLGPESVRVGDAVRLLEPAAAAAGEMTEHACLLVSGIRMDGGAPVLVGKKFRLRSLLNRPGFVAVPWHPDDPADEDDAVPASEVAGRVYRRWPYIPHALPPSLLPFTPLDSVPDDSDILSPPTPRPPPPRGDSGYESVLGKRRRTPPPSDAAGDASRSTRGRRAAGSEGGTPTGAGTPSGSGSGDADDASEPPSRDADESDGGSGGEDGGGSGDDDPGGRRGRAGVRCHVCGTAHTPAWRRTVDGRNYLCNACGLKERKRAHLRGGAPKAHRRRESAPAAPSGKPAPAPPDKDKPDQPKPKDREKDKDKDRPKKPAPKKRAATPPSESGGDAPPPPQPKKPATPAGEKPKPSHARSRSDGAAPPAPPPAAPAQPAKPRFADEFAGGMGLMQVYRCTVAGCPKWFYGKGQLRTHLASHEEEAQEEEEQEPEQGRARRARGQGIEEVVKARHSGAAPPAPAQAKEKDKPAPAKDKEKPAAAKDAEAKKEGGKKDKGKAPADPPAERPSPAPSKQQRRASVAGDASDSEDKKVVFEQPNKEGTLLVNGVATYPLCSFPKCNRWFYTKGQLRSHMKSAHGIDTDPEPPKAKPEKKEESPQVEDEFEAKREEAAADASEASPAPEDAAPAPAADPPAEAEPAPRPQPKKKVKGGVRPEPAARAKAEAASESEADSARSLDGAAGDAASSARRAGTRAARAADGRGVSASWSFGERPNRSMSPEERDKRRRTEVEDLMTLDDFPRCRYPGCDKWFYSRGQLKSHERQHQEEEEAERAAAAAGQQADGSAAGDCAERTRESPSEIKTEPAQSRPEPRPPLQRSERRASIASSSHAKGTKPAAATQEVARPVVDQEPAAGGAQQARPRANSKPSVPPPALRRSSSVSLKETVRDAPTPPSASSEPMPGTSRSRAPSISLPVHPPPPPKEPTDRLPPRRKTEAPLDEVLLRMNALSRSAVNPSAFGMGMGGGRRTSERQRAAMESRILQPEPEPRHGSSRHELRQHRSQPRGQEYDEDEGEWDMEEGEYYEEEEEDEQFAEQEEMDPDAEMDEVPPPPKRHSAQVDLQYPAPSKKRKHHHHRPHLPRHMEPEEEFADQAAPIARPGSRASTQGEGFDIVATLVSLRTAPVEKKKRPKSPRPPQVAGEHGAKTSSRPSDGHPSSRSSPNQHRHKRPSHTPAKSSPLAGPGGPLAQHARLPMPTVDTSAAVVHGHSSYKPSFPGAPAPGRPDQIYVPWVSGAHVSLPAIVIPTGSPVRAPISFYGGAPPQAGQQSGKDSPASTPSTANSTFNMWFQAPAQLGQPVSVSLPPIVAGPFQPAVQQSVGAAGRDSGSPRSASSATAMQGNSTRSDTAGKVEEPADSAPPPKPAGVPGPEAAVANGGTEISVALVEQTAAAPAEKMVSMEVDETGGEPKESLSASAAADQAVIEG